MPTITLSASANITGGTCNSIDLSWSNPHGFTSVFLFRNGTSYVTWSTPDSHVNSGAQSYSDSSITPDTSYNYQIVVDGADFSNTTSNITPRDLNAPTIGVSTLSGTTITANWSYSGSTVDYFNVYRDIDGGGYSVITTRSSSSNAYDDGSVSHGQVATYKVGAVLSGYTEQVSDASNSITMVTNYTDTISDFIDVGVTHTDTLIASDAILDGVWVDDLVLDQANFYSTVSDTIDITDAVGSAQSLKTDFTYYLGTEVGAIYESSQDYQYDDTATSGTSVQAAIVPVWWSKVIDFAEADEENTGKWKGLYRVELIYRDWGSIPVTVHVSHDGGATWESKTKVLGSHTNGRTEHAHFHFYMTGQFFLFKIEWPSSTADFQFLGIDVVYEPTADEFDVLLDE
jgi:hypothetical protein